MQNGWLRNSCRTSVHSWFVSGSWNVNILYFVKPNLEAHEMPPLRLSHSCVIPFALSHNFQHFYFFCAGVSWSWANGSWVFRESTKAPFLKCCSTIVTPLSMTATGTRWASLLTGIAGLQLRLYENTVTAPEDLTNRRAFFAISL